MIANQQDSWDLGFRKTHHPLAPFLLEGWLGVPIFVSVPGKEDEIDLFFNGRINYLIQGVKEIHHPDRQGGLGIMTAVIGNINMGVGKVQNADR
jgi:hypothetical protein